MFYKLLIFIHIISAIIGIGPGFVLTYIVKDAKTMTELRHTYKVRKQIHLFVMIGGMLLLVTGLLLGLLNPTLFHQGWYLVSLLLYLVALAFGPFVLAPCLQPIKQIMEEHVGDDIPEEYDILSKKLFFYERVENSILLVIIILMILKPF